MEQMHKKQKSWDEVSKLKFQQTNFEVFHIIGTLHFLMSLLVNNIDK